ncbi:hypothetical protein DPO94_21000 [Salmonella enterica subsp. enterica serovar Emek]|jgi:predicted phosphodiesterase|uniref:DUF4177 domain-containing protein n=1 Tax=Citrobacter braakii TaxID=57706 RepID=A0A1V8NZJ3_CITBR|nr:hypothetical protein [Citrobacter braakii]EBS6398442.1 hypothetical protein [Salmonella enterica subsp. enterica serovar Emek]EDB5835341.1 hypothetical protein [Salmonella enterica subsp. enterica serovar Agona]EKW6310425.1 hypothetical protein [Escherichia coli]ELA3624968.1 hypothetical protein [Salmonella enterica]HAU5687408.1 hypothetical protein [Citrobacter freundii]
MSDQQFDITKVKEVNQIEDSAKVNRLLAQGWVLLKVSESQWRDDEGAIRSTIIYTVGNTD